jgi:hypothetical protein
LSEAGLLQRLYSTFANGWPGRGLALLRVAVFLFLIEPCLVSRPLYDHDVWPSKIAVVGGVLLLVGLWTPISGASTALLELWLAFRVGDCREAHLLATALAGALAVLGPGALSVDARLFGRRRISIEER